MTWQGEPFVAAGGIDRDNPPFAVKPGRVTVGHNYIVPPNGGYQRIDGYERVDGYSFVPSYFSENGIIYNFTNGALEITNRGVFFKSSGGAYGYFNGAPTLSSGSW